MHRNCWAVIDFPFFFAYQIFKWINSIRKWPRDKWRTRLRLSSPQRTAWNHQIQSRQSSFTRVGLHLHWKYARYFFRRYLGACIDVDINQEPFINLFKSHTHIHTSTQWKMAARSPRNISDFYLAAESNRCDHEKKEIQRIWIENIKEWKHVRVYCSARQCRAENGRFSFESCVRDSLASIPFVVRGDVIGTHQMDKHRYGKCVKLQFFLAIKSKVRFFGQKICFYYDNLSHTMAPINGFLFCNDGQSIFIAFIEIIYMYLDTYIWVEINTSEDNFIAEGLLGAN